MSAGDTVLSVEYLTSKRTGPRLAGLGPDIPQRRWTLVDLEAGSVEHRPLEQPRRELFVVPYREYNPDLQDHYAFAYTVDDDMVTTLDSFETADSVAAGAAGVYAISSMNYEMSYWR